MKNINVATVICFSLKMYHKLPNQLTKVNCWITKLTGILTVSATTYRRKYTWISLLEHSLLTAFWICYFSSKTSLNFSWRLNNSAVSDEKQHNNHLHSVGTNRWPSTSSSNFCASIFHLHVECNWESDNHIPHYIRFPP